MKKITRTIVAVLLIVSCLLTVAVPTQAAYFTDVSRSTVGSETFDAINYMADNGYMVGTSTTHFSPTQNLTRAMFVSILYRYSGSAEKYTNSFTDVPTGTYYYYAVGWAAHYNIVAGVTTTQFAPNNYVTREQALAFLYRYATKYLGLSYSKTASITGHADYTSVSNYARPSVSWAKAYNILQLGSNSAPINPKSSINRATAALYFTRYSYFADKVYTRDKFSFKNLPENFASSSSSMLLSNAMKNRLFSCVNNYYGAGTDAAKNNITMINKAISANWNGSCRGMSMAVLLNKLGKIDFNRNFGNDASNMWNIAIPKDNSTCESAINYYQVSQTLTGQIYPNFVANLNQSGTEIVDANNVRNGAYSFIGYLNSWGPTILSFGFIMNPGTKDAKISGHAVIALSATYDSTNGRYNIRAIDPNYEQISVLTLKITSDGVEIGNIPEIYRIGYFTKDSLNFWDNFDIDGAYNDFTNLKQMDASEDISATNAYFESDNANNYDGTSILMVPYATFAIENAEGETLVCNGASLSGDMPVLESWAYPTQIDEPMELYIRVNTSDWFEYSTASEVASYFFVTTPKYFGGADGAGIRRIRVNTDNTVEFDGDNVDYRIMVPANKERDCYVLYGHAEDNITIQRSEECLYTSGLSGQTAVKFFGSDGRESEKQIITLNRQEEAIRFFVSEDSLIIGIPESNQQITANWLE